MADITATAVKELREQSGAGMMDCKKALIETDGDMEQAIDWLRKKGLAAAAKKSGRVAAEGLVAVLTAQKIGIVAEVNTETDFVARNPDFQSFVQKIADTALSQGGSFEKTVEASFANGKSVSESVTEMVSSIGENVTFRRSNGCSVKEGIVASYVHNASAPNMGKIGVIVGLESTGKMEILEDFGKKLAMHIAAAKPGWISSEDVGEKQVNREREILAGQARESGKAEEIVQKMVVGRMRKYFEEVCLLEQTFVIDGESKVSKAIELAAKEAGASIKITDFVRFQLGDGIEKQNSDFAAEVAATADR